jgi:hypothetical protein
MLRLTERRRAICAEKFGDLANYAIAALVFGQPVGQDSFSVGVGVAGIAISLLFMGGTFFLSGESQ